MSSSAPRHAAPGPWRRTLWLLVEVRDRFRVSDPGLGRLRGALAAVVSVGTAIPVQLGIGALLGYEGQAGFVAAMFGAVVAMLGANALNGTDTWGKVKTAVFFPVAVAVGVIPATFTAGRELYQVIGFAVTLFLAVYVRRFGLSWFFYGFMGWMGFFFATFLRATLDLVPELLVAAVASTAWVLLLSTTVFRTNPRAVLKTTLAAFFTTGRSVARRAADLLETTEGTDRRGRAMRRLQDAQAAMASTSLLAEAWSAERGAVPEGWSASALRRRLLETQQAVDRFAGAAVTLRGADPRLVEGGWTVLDHLAARRDLAAVAAACRLQDDGEAVRDRLVGRHADDDSGWWPALHLAHAVREFLEFDVASASPPEVDPGEEEFEAATGLVFGGLAGSPAVARDVRPRGGRFNPLLGLSMSTRQAVQVTIAGVIAIAAGTLLSPQRYYWAVIAAFVTFTGTGTRSETFLKGAARVGGTLVGIAAAIGLAHVTIGHTPAIFAAILVSIFLAFYLQKVSYAAMTFFITVLLGQLYTVLGTFSDSLLALRLGETAVGAIAGVAVALLFTPLSTRDTVRAARDELLTAMSEMLQGAAAYADGARVDLDALTRTLDDHARRLTLVYRPLVRPLIPGNSSTSSRRRLQLYVAAVSQCRALSLALQRRPVPDVEVAPAARALAHAAEELTSVGVGAAAPEAGQEVRAGDRALFERSTGRDEEPVVRHLHHLAGTLTQIAGPTPRPTLEPAQPAGADAA
ncbi:FUSC family protein [Marmoricola endophyticus]|uniref:FUSC family protein n=1 Tax=Marmoricola endophyticus TaxID=2040280 RepID=A0A917BH92_9ACTN|nr:FUSC family protein [Marmoricola endophyticus]GGF45546.1 FUSC family protein [Marmoricola endophyticus]